MCSQRARAAVVDVLAQHVGGLLGPVPVADHQLRRRERDLADLAGRQLARALVAVEDADVTSGSGMPTEPILFGPFTGLTQSAIIASVSE